MFAAGNNQFMQIIVQPNPEKRPVEEWYREQTGVAFLKSEQTIYKNGWLGVRSEDGLTSYLTKPGGENIFVVAYSPGAGDILSYGNIYAIMVRSLEISE